MQSYVEAAERLGNRQSRKLQNNTYLQRRDAQTVAVLYHATDVVTFHADGRTILTSGGWRTSTTKERLGYGPGRVSQDKGQWYYYPNGWQGPRYVFADGMTIQGDKISGAELFKPEKHAAALKLRRKVQKFAADYMAAMDTGEVKAPSAGDCLYCRKTTTGDMLGEAFKNSDHILTHIQEKYYVPSLLARAVEVFPVSMVAKWYISDKWAGTTNNVSPDFARQQLQKALSRYCLRQIGQAS